MASDKYVALVRLFEGEEPKVIADELGLSQGTVYRYKKELTTAQDEGKVNSLLAAEQGALDNMAQQAVADMPSVLAEGELVEANAVIDGVKGLARLEADLQQTASKINCRIRLMAGTAESVGDVVDLAEALCKLQSAFFGKGTQVLIQNNNNSGGTETYGQFLSDAPGSPT